MILGQAAYEAGFIGPMKNVTVVQVKSLLYHSHCFVSDLPMSFMNINVLLYLSREKMLHLLAWYDMNKYRYINIKREQE